MCTTQKSICAYRKKKKTRISPPVVFIQCMNYWWWKTRVKRWMARTCVWNLCICIYNRVEHVFFSFPFDGLFHTAASGDDGRGRRNSCWISIPNSSRTAVALLRVERNPLKAWTCVTISLRRTFFREIFYSFRRWRAMILIDSTHTRVTGARWNRVNFL